MIIELSDLFDITIDELLRSDEDLTEKIIQDNKQLKFLDLKGYFMLVVGVLSGILLVSFLKNGELNWTITGATFAFSVLGFFILLLIRFERKRARAK